MTKKCGTCFWFIVKPDEIELARHAAHISRCQPGMPHCLGGQTRGACEKWRERAELGLPMPWGLGPMVESTFGCKLWKAGGPRPRVAGSRSQVSNKIPMKNYLPLLAPLIALAVGRMGGSSNKLLSTLQKHFALAKNMEIPKEYILSEIARYDSLPFLNAKQRKLLKELHKYLSVIQGK